MSAFLTCSFLILSGWDSWQRKARPTRSAWERDPLGVIIGWIIIAAILWILFLIIRNIVRRVKGVYGEIRQKRHEAEMDLKYDKLINCPSCSGDGDLRGTKCPYCLGSGTAYAWFEKVATHKIECGACSGTGLETRKVKLEIGAEIAEVPCRSCNGTGAIAIEGKEVVHIKTIASDQKNHIPKVFDVELNSSNRMFYSKSKPRF